MSRVYNALTGAGRPAVAASETPDDGGWLNTEEDTPFVEIGGPAGPVTSVPAPAPKPQPHEPARAFPRLVPNAPVPVVPTPAVLSVSFHDVVPRIVHPASDVPDSSLVVYHAPEHPVSGEYRTLRTEIQQQLPEAGARVLLFASAVPESGTTTVLLNLAISLTQEGRGKVLVVDAAVRRPAIARKLALKPSPGLCEVLAQQVPLTWVTQPTLVEGLHALTAGEPTEATPAAMTRDLSRLLTQLRQWYDWVLVDVGVWGAMPERDTAGPTADAVYLVTRESDAERLEFTTVRGRVKETGGLLRGYVTTRA